MAQNIDIASADVVEKIKAALTANNIDFSCDYSANEIAAAAMTDKKRQGQELILILPQKIGHCIQYKIKAEDLEKLIAPCLMRRKDTE